MKVLYIDPTLTRCEVANKLRHTHGFIRYQFNQFSILVGSIWPKSGSEKKCVDSSQRLFPLHRSNNWLRNLITGDESLCVTLKENTKLNLDRNHIATPQKPSPKSGLHPKKGCSVFDGTWKAYYRGSFVKVKKNVMRYLAITQ